MISRTSNWRVRRGSRRGAAVVEFAFVAVLLVTFIMGAIDVGQYTKVSRIVNDASCEGARQSSRVAVSSASEVEAIVEAYLANALDTPGLTATVNVSDSLGVPIPAGDLTTIPSGDAFTVQVIFQYDSVRWLRGLPILNGVTLETTTTVRRD